MKTRWLTKILTWLEEQAHRVSLGIRRVQAMLRRASASMRFGIWALIDTDKKWFQGRNAKATNDNYVCAELTNSVKMLVSVMMLAQEIAGQARNDAEHVG